jgi:hypothetical protein
MSKAMPWSKFCWADWMCDAELSLCSLAAQGLWMRMLCQMDASNERGFLVSGGRATTPAEIAKLVCCDRRTVERLLVELEERRVFSRDDRGAIFSRRMTRDDAIARRNATNGQRGGNPVLLKNKDISDLPVNPQVKAEEETEEDKEAEKQEEEHAAVASPPPVASNVVSLMPAKPTRKFRLPADWRPSPAEFAYAAERDLDVERTAADFRDYWTAKGEARAGWTGSWQMWCRKQVDYRGGQRGGGRAPASKIGWVIDALRDMSPEPPPHFDFDAVAERI